MFLLITKLGKVARYVLNVQQVHVNQKQKKKKNTKLSHTVDPDKKTLSRMHVLNV